MSRVACVGRLPGDCGGVGPAGGRATLLPVFEDVTEAAGLNFKHGFGDEKLSNIVEGTGAGAMFFDYDGDGWLDIYLVNGCYRPDVNDNTGRRLRGQLSNALYRNNQRRHVYRRDRESRRGRWRHLRLRLFRGRLRRRRRPRPAGFELRAQPALSQQWRRHVYRRHREGRRGRRPSAGAFRASGWTTTPMATWTCSSRTTWSTTPASFALSTRRRDTQGP